MWKADTADGSCFLIVRWGWNWLSIYRFRLYAGREATGDYLQFFSIDCGPIAFKLPGLRIRRDKWWRHKEA